MISVIQVILTGIILGHDCIADQIQDQSCIGSTELFKKNRTDPGFFDQLPQHKVIPDLQAAASRIVLFCFRQFSIRKEAQKICIRVHPASVLIRPSAVLSRGRTVVSDRRPFTHAKNSSTSGAIDFCRSLSRSSAVISRRVFSILYIAAIRTSA